MSRLFSREHDRCYCEECYHPGLDYAIENRAVRHLVSCRVGGFDLVCVRG